MSGEYLERLKAERPDVDWAAEMTSARRRRDRQWRNPWNRIVHRVHAMRHPELHRQACSACRGPLPATMLQPVTFDDNPGEARTVRMVPVDEGVDDW